MKLFKKETPTTVEDAAGINRLRMLVERHKPEQRTESILPASNIPSAAASEPTFRRFWTPQELAAERDA